MQEMKVDPRNEVLIYFWWSEQKMALWGYQALLVMSASVSKFKTPWILRRFHFFPAFAHSDSVKLWRGEMVRDMLFVWRISWAEGIIKINKMPVSVKMQIDDGSNILRYKEKWCEREDLNLSNWKIIFMSDKTTINLNHNMWSMWCSSSPNCLLQIQPDYLL